jgi:hypothetical protein
MKYIKIIIIIPMLVVITSCTKDDRKVVKEGIDTASQKLGRELDTLVNTTVYGDSLYKNAPRENIDTSAISRKPFRDNLNDIFDEYADIKDELADDDSAAVTKQADEFQQALMKAQTEAASEKLTSTWKLWVSSVEKITADLKAASTIEKQRMLFSELTASVEAMIKNFGLSDMTVYRVSCATVKQKNNYWLTDSKDNANPYFGKNKTNEKSTPCITVEKVWEYK